MKPTLGELVLYFLRLGGVGFGGPAALVDRMREDLVDRLRWVTPDDFDMGLAIAAACPGPLAYQLAVFFGYTRHGVGGAFAVGAAFALVPFLLVVAAAAAYQQWSTNAVARGMFYGAGPVVVALIARACWGLGRKTLHRSWLAWATAAAGFVLTWSTAREPLWLFVVGGVLGAVLLRPADPPQTRVKPPDDQHRGTPSGVLAGFIGAALAGTNAQLFGFFFKTGCLVFGSGLVIVPFLRGAVVETYGWLDLQQFLDSVTVGLVSPGPVVITATFVGYAVGHVDGALAATAGMFLPAILFTIVATPWFIRHRHRPALTGFVRGVTAAVVGVLAGTVPLVAGPAVPDVAAAVILGLGLAAAIRRTVPDPMIIAIGALAGVGVALS